MVSQCSADKDTDLLQCETVAEDAVSGHYGDVSGLLGEMELNRTFIF